MKKILAAALLLTINYYAMAQDTKIIRIARITVDSAQLAEYTTLLQEQMQAAIKAEPGVLSYTVYADKTTPYKLTIVEEYADNKAYLSHRETAHFKKYKSATINMVKSLELVEVNPLLAVKK